MYKIKEHTVNSSVTICQLGRRASRQELTAETHKGAAVRASGRPNWDVSISSSHQGSGSWAEKEAERLWEPGISTFLRRPQLSTVAVQVCTPPAVEQGPPCSTSSPARAQPLRTGRRWLWVVPICISLMAKGSDRTYFSAVWVSSAQSSLFRFLPHFSMDYLVCW